ncbi:MAG: JAB domain-containing protein [Bacteroidia bacterium]
MQVKLKKQDKIKLLNSGDIYAIMQKVLLRENKIERNKEHFWIIGLATNNRILYIELITVGTINRTIVEPMEVFSIALQKRSVKIVMVHNHPSGEMRPSEEDKDITDRLIQVGNFLNVPVLEHLIISETSFYSFNDSGLLAQLSESKKYGLPYKEEQRIKKEAEELGRDKQKKEIARELKAKGMDIASIAAVTGLSKEQIKKLKLPAKKKPPTS